MASFSRVDTDILYTYVLYTTYRVRPLLLLYIMYDIPQQLSVVRVCERGRVRYSSAVGMAATGRVCGPKSRVPPHTHAGPRRRIPKASARARARAALARVWSSVSSTCVARGRCHRGWAPPPILHGPYSMPPSKLPPHDRYTILSDDAVAAAVTAATEHYSPFLINIRMDRCTRPAGARSPAAQISHIIPVGS